MAGPIISTTVTSNYGTVSSGVSVVSGGVFQEYGTAKNTFISAGGDITIGNSAWTGGAEYNTTVLSGGSDILFGADGMVIGADTVVFAGGSETVLNGIAFGTVLSGGKQIVEQQLHNGVAAIARDTVILDGGVQVVEIYPGGAAGSAVSAVVSSGGVQIVSSGGVASATTVKSGGEQLRDGGAIVSGTVFSGGIEGIQSGFTTSGLVLSRTGVATLAVGSGGTASGTQVTSGMSEIVSGVTALGSGSIVSAGGSETVTSGGKEIGGRDSGMLSVGSGGVLQNETVASGGSATLSAGAVASNTVISGSTLVLSGGANATGSIDFAGSGGTLVIEGKTMPTGTVSGFNPGMGDTILFSGIPASGATLTSSGNSLTIHEGGSNYTLNISSSTPGFTLVNDGGVVELLPDIPCFAAGTHILTPEGELRVEDIAVGDRVITMREGGPATRKVVWTGKRSVDIARHPEPELLWPVRILAGAFGPNMPERDLRLSPHHAVYVDGHFFEAQSLVNGVSVIVERTTRYITYHHIELEAHDVMLAEGLPAESFLNTGNRQVFEQGSAPVTLHPDFRPQGDDGFCVPMVREGEKLAALRAWLNERARIHGAGMEAGLARTA